MAKANLSIFMVTHDRYFLDKVTNEILELDQGKIHRYQGNYGYFLDKKAERMQIEDIEIEKAKSLYKKELDWIRRQPKARGTKAKYRVDAFEETKEKAFTKREERDIELTAQVHQRCMTAMEPRYHRQAGQARQGPAGPPRQKGWQGMGLRCSHGGGVS